MDKPNQNTSLRHIKRALLSVSDKTGLLELARLLDRFKVEIISTGGTAKALREAGLNVRDVSDVTGFPEIMDGRVKTLHPRIHGALLALRDNVEHQSTGAEHGIEMIDLVVVNLYPFEKTAARAGISLEEVIEQIDIGGPSMIRSAAKNYRDVAVVVSPESYAQIESELNQTGGALSLQTRERLALQAFARTAQYDTAISSYLSTRFLTQQNEELSSSIKLDLKKVNDLRYGENPHQRAALYEMSESGNRSGIAFAELISGKEMSFNNYVDADAAWQLACDFNETACSIIKHTNPAGAALGHSPVEAYRRALATDPVSAFGGVIAFNRTVDVDAARAVTEIFTEVIVAPDFTAEATEVLRAKKNLRILRVGSLPERRTAFDYKPISGGMLVQTPDAHQLQKDDLQIVSKRAPSEAEISSLLFAWTVCKHTKSNAIVYARDGQTVGVGAGQMSRVDSVRIGAMRALLPLENSVLASDAFFPFRDGIDEAAKHGITAVIHPGGSVRDEEVIKAADEHNLAMVITGVRHFKH